MPFRPSALIRVTYANQNTPDPPVKMAKPPIHARLYRLGDSGPATPASSPLAGSAGVCWFLDRAMAWQEPGGWRLEVVLVVVLSVVEVHGGPDGQMLFVTWRPTECDQSGEDCLSPSVSLSPMTAKQRGCSGEKY